MLRDTRLTNEQIESSDGVLTGGGARDRADRDDRARRRTRPGAAGPDALARLSPLRHPRRPDRRARPRGRDPPRRRRPTPSAGRSPGSRALRPPPTSSSAGSRECTGRGRSRFWSSQVPRDEGGLRQWRHRVILAETGAQALAELSDLTLSGGTRRTMRRVVTIDGPAGAGKSTVARTLAERLGWRLLDTGAMYRAVTLAALRARSTWKATRRSARWPAESRSACHPAACCSTARTSRPWSVESRSPAPHVTWPTAPASAASSLSGNARSPPSMT